MELKIEEFDYYANDEYKTNYWEQPNYITNTSNDFSKNIEKKKKKVSFDDILTNMNLVVNDKGVLQQMIPKNINSNISNYDNEYNNLNISNQQSVTNNMSQSYIYNKYFKDYYKNQNEFNKPQPKIPKNIQEYKIMLLQEKIKYIAEKKRINEIKPKKLLFISNQSISNKSIQPTIRTLNNLNKLNFQN